MLPIISWDIVFFCPEKPAKNQGISFWPMRNNPDLYLDSNFAKRHLGTDLNVAFRKSYVILLPLP